MYKYVILMIRHNSVYQDTTFLLTQYCSWNFHGNAAVDRGGVSIWSCRHVSETLVCCPGTSSEHFESNPITQWEFYRRIRNSVIKLL